MSQDLTHLKALAEAASQGDWEASGSVVWMPDVEYGMEPDCCGNFNRDGSCCGNAVPRQTEELVQREIANADGADAAFIAAANPKAVLELIAENERLREALGAITVNTYGLQGIMEEHSGDANAYNYHAMKYWNSEVRRLKGIAREAMEKSNG